MRPLTRSTIVKLGQLFGDTRDGEAPSFLGFERCLDLNTLAADIACFDIVEFMPECDPKGLAALTAAQLVWNAIGLIAR